MTTDDLFNAIGEIDEDLVDFAEDYEFKKRNKFPAMKYLLTAAAILLVVAIGPKLTIILDHMIGSGSSTDNSCPEATPTMPETAINQAKNFLLFELSGVGKTKIVCHYPSEIALKPINFTETSPGGFEIDSDGEWSLELLFSSIEPIDPDAITFDFTPSEAGISVEKRFISAEDAEKITK